TLDALRPSGMLGAADPDRRHRHALGADRPAALGAGKPRDAVGMAVTGPLDGCVHVGSSVVGCRSTSLSRPAQPVLPPSASSSTSVPASRAASPAPTSTAPPGACSS